MRSSAFPIAQQGSRSTRGKATKGPHSLRPSVSASSYTSPSMRNLSSIWVPGESKGEQAFVSSPSPPAQDLPREELSHVSSELVFPFCTAPTHWEHEKVKKRKKKNLSQEERQEGESCSLKPGRSKGICSFILSRRGAAVFPPVPLKHNSWFQFLRLWACIPIATAQNTISQHWCKGVIFAGLIYTWKESSRLLKHTFIWKQGFDNRGN